MTREIGQNEVRTLAKRGREADNQASRTVLAAVDGNLSSTARRLGVSPPILYRKLGQHGIRRSLSG